MVKFVSKERLDQISTTEKHQGVIAYAAAYEYAEVPYYIEAIGGSYCVTSHESKRSIYRFDVVDDVITNVSTLQ